MSHQPLMNKITALGRQPRCSCGWIGGEVGHMHWRRGQIRRQVFGLLAGHLHNPKAA